MVNYIRICNGMATDGGGHGDWTFETNVRELGQGLETETILTISTIPNYENPVFIIWYSCKDAEYSMLMLPCESSSIDHFLLC